MSGKDRDFTVKERQRYVDVADAVPLGRSYPRGRALESCGSINWRRMPEIEEFGALADHISAAGYYGADELADTSNAERAQPS